MTCIVPFKYGFCLRDNDSTSDKFREGYIGLLKFKCVIEKYNMLKGIVFVLSRRKILNSITIKVK